MNDNNSYFLVHKWMITDLGLNPAEVLVFALLYSICVHNKRCFPSQKYIAECTGMTRETINRVIKRLCKNNLLIKGSSSNSLSSCEYNINPELLKRCDEKSHQGVTEKHRGCDSESHNNKEYNKDYNNNYHSYYTNRYKNKRRNDGEDWGYQY